MTDSNDGKRDPKEILSTLAGICPELKKRYSVRTIGIFGSYSRGVARPDSDVDIIVELDEQTLDSYMDLKFRLEDVLSRPVDLVLADTVKPRLRPIIEKEVIYVQG